MYCNSIPKRFLSTPKVRLHRKQCFKYPELYKRPPEGLRTPPIPAPCISNCSRFVPAFLLAKSLGTQSSTIAGAFPKGLLHNTERRSWSRDRCHSSVPLKMNIVRLTKHWTHCHGIHQPAMLGATMKPEPGQACSYFPLAMRMVARNVVSLCARAHDISPGNSMGQ